MKRSQLLREEASRGDNYDKCAGDDVDSLKSSCASKGNRLSLTFSRKEPVLSQGIIASKALAENIEINGLDYYYDIGRSASSSRVLNRNQTDTRLRVERMFFEFQERRRKPPVWPDDGLEIDHCTAFMALLAESGKGAIDEKITYDYFRKLCKCFADLVSKALKH